MVLCDQHYLQEMVGILCSALKRKAAWLDLGLTQGVEIVGWPNLDDDHKCSIVQTRRM